MKLGRKTLNIVYVTLFLITITLSLLVIAFSALNSYFNNPIQLYYPADINNGRTLNQAIKLTSDYQDEDSTVTRVVFDYYTDYQIVDDGEQETVQCSYIQNGQNVIEGVIGNSITWDSTTVDLYRTTNAGGDKQSTFYQMRI